MCTFCWTVNKNARYSHEHLVKCHISRLLTHFFESREMCCIKCFHGVHIKYGDVHEKLSKRRLAYQNYIYLNLCINTNPLGVNNNSLIKASEHVHCH